MTLRVVGTGFGRTGTLSLKAALEQLGFGPCYHMMEVWRHPEHVAMWTAAGREGRASWETLFAGYNATVDWPSTRFWRELVAHYPNAKVIHTEREPEVWYKSFERTISELLQSDSPPETKAWSEMAALLISQQTFGQRFDKASVLDVYNKHNAEVRRLVPANRLLIYDVSQGWEPLAAFLGAAVPSDPFPKTNSTEEFRARAAARRGRAAT